MFCKAKSAKNKEIAQQFKTTSKQKCSNLSPLLFITFPQGFRISKNIRHQTLGSGGKETFKRYLKSEHTDRRTNIWTDRQTDISTYRKHRPSGPMFSISRNVRLSVCLCVCVSVCSLLRYHLTVFLPPLPKVKCPIFLEIQNPCGKVIERSVLTFEHYCLEVV